MPQGTPRSLTIGDLPLHRAVAGLVENGEGKRLHDQRGHEVLEHASAPGHQRRLARGVGQGAVQVEPVLHRHIVLGDRDEAGQPGLRRQQVVERGVERVRGRAGSRWRTVCATRSKRNRKSISIA